MLKNSLLPNAPWPLDIATYDGSGQCVHPDVLRLDGRFYGFNYLMALEPYPYSQDHLENPSLYGSDDGVYWATPSGIVNPLVPEPAVVGSWYSDADLLHYRRESLLLYYRYNSGKGETTLFCQRSDDGVGWSVPQQTFTVNPSGKFASPALVEHGEDLYMFYVDTLGTTVRIARSRDLRRWIEDHCLFFFPRAWHLDAVWYGGSFYLLLNDKRSLFLLSSRDLARWFVLASSYLWGDQARWQPLEPQSEYLPLIAPSSGGWDNGLIYRGTMLIEDESLNIWYSAMSESGIWKIGYTNGSVTA